MCLSVFTTWVLLCLCINITYGTYIRESKVRYDDYKVLRVQTPDVNAMKYISNPDHKSLYNIWKKPMIDGYSDIMIAPQNMAKVISGLNRTRLEFSSMIDDVQKLIDIESKPVTKIIADHPMTWTEYHPYEDMEKYMDYLEKTYPDLVSIEDIGKSYEGRSMKVLKICKGGKCGDKPAMWIDGGIHAREWISPAVATYHIRELVENREYRESDMLDKLDWYILPVHNPDGYEYSRTKDCPIEECRMWRKNRTPDLDSGCIGTDLNRNYGYKWNHGGSSNDPCNHEEYMGKAANSEPEVRNVQKFLYKVKDRVKYYQNLHAYSELILFPWGFTDEECPDHEAMKILGYRAAVALHDKHGENYTVKSAFSIYSRPTSGTALDWAKGELKIPYAYTIELRGKADNPARFLLPPEQIIPTGEEIMAFHVVVAQQIVQEFASFVQTDLN